MFGASGKTGRAVVRALRARGAFVRAVVCSPMDPGDERIGGADEVAVADLSDPERVCLAVEDAGGVYLMAPNMYPDEPAALGVAVEHCVAQRIPRVVFHSVMHPYAPSMPHHLDKARVESLLHDSDLDWSILQPASYLENVGGAARRVAADGLWPVPYPPEARFTPVALDDVASVAARVLTEAGHRRSTYELAGPQDLSTAEMAAVLAEVLDRSVAARYDPAGPAIPDRLRAMFEHYAVAGFRGSPRALTQLLGHTPTSWRTWCEQHRGEFLTVPTAEETPPVLS